MRDTLWFSKRSDPDASSRWLSISLLIWMSMISLNISPRGAPCPAGNLVMDNRLIIYGKSGFWVHSLFRPFRLRSVRRLVVRKNPDADFFSQCDRPKSPYSSNEVFIKKLDHYERKNATFFVQFWLVFAEFCWLTFPKHFFRLAHVKERVSKRSKTKFYLKSPIILLRMHFWS